MHQASTSTCTSTTGRSSVRSFFSFLFHVEEKRNLRERSIDSDCYHDTVCNPPPGSTAHVQISMLLWDLMLLLVVHHKYICYSYFVDSHSFSSAPLPTNVLVSLFRVNKLATATPLLFVLVSITVRCLVPASKENTNFRDLGPYSRVKPMAF